MIKIVEANTDDLITKAKELFQEYAESLGFDLCFQNFDQELDDFPGQYSPPMGRLFLALSENQPIGVDKNKKIDKKTKDHIDCLLSLTIDHSWITHEGFAVYRSYEYGKLFGVTFDIAILPTEYKEAYKAHIEDLLLSFYAEGLLWYC